MQPTGNIRIGMTGEAETVVTPELTVKHLDPKCRDGGNVKVSLVYAAFAAVVLMADEPERLTHGASFLPPRHAEGMPSA